MRSKVNKTNSKLAGGLILLGMITGVLSISPQVDSVDYLTQAANHSTGVITASLFQFVLALMYLIVGLLLYPILYQVHKSGSISFLSFRIVASTLMIVGTVLLLSVLLLSQGNVSSSGKDSEVIEMIGNMIKYSRDYFNHVFMVLVLGIGNLILYFLFIKSRMIPAWLSYSGVIGTVLSIAASLLLMFQAVDVITTEYLILNAPTAMVEVVLGFWLLIKGIRQPTLLVAEN